MKIQATDLDKILAKHITDKGLVSQNYRDLLKINNRKRNKPIKMDKGSEQTPPQEDIQMANDHKKR